MAKAVRMHQTRGVDENRRELTGDGDQMHSELDDITRRLQRLKRSLDARKSVYEGPHDDLSSGDAVGMNPLTAWHGEPPLS